MKMSCDITLNFLKEIEKNGDLNLFVKILNLNYIILDEENDFKGISSMVLEKWNIDCTKYIIDKGYENSEAKFNCLAFEIKNRGFVYCLFDSNMMNFDVAKKYVLSYKYV